MVKLTLTNDTGRHLLDLTVRNHDEAQGTNAPAVEAELDATAEAAPQYEPDASRVATLARYIGSLMPAPRQIFMSDNEQ